MTSFLHRPLHSSDDLFRRLRGCFPAAEVERAVTAAGVEVLGVRVPRERARDVWEEWRGRHGESGWWPYITLISPTDMAERRAELGRDDGVLEHWVREAVCQDHDATAASILVSACRWAVEEAANVDDDLDLWRSVYDPDRLAPLLQPPVERPLRGVSHWATGTRDFFTEDLRWLHFVAARGGYEVPVLLPFLYTTWNWSGYADRGLTPLDASALLRRWHEQWGAELFFAMGPRLELVVDRPPLDPRGAAQAVAELHAYCIDTVQDSVEAGDTMARSTMWSLWWD
ncbi:DUF4253 domain-containing protein [Streptomyces sp. NPDC005389]|uniref:DUF4253 domain-containing protein n=1 Tax=Streptomyces sp. NPDC005389 TaxID=3157040 RepID=UPI0033B661B3